MTTTDRPELDERAIRDLVARAQTFQNDLPELLALHTPEAVVVNIAGRRVLGREALADAMARALDSALRDVRTTVEIVDIRPAGADVAVVSCVKTVRDGRAPGGAELPAAGALTYVLTRGGNGWRIAVAQTTPM